MCAGMNSHDESAVSDVPPSMDAGTPSPFDVLHESEAMAKVAEIAKKSGVIRSLEDFKQQFAHDRRRLDEQKQVDARERQRQQKVGEAVRCCLCVVSCRLNGVT